MGRFFRARDGASIARELEEDESGAKTHRGVYVAWDCGCVEVYISKRPLEMGRTKYDLVVTSDSKFPMEKGDLYSLRANRRWGFRRLSKKFITVTIDGEIAVLNSQEPHFLHIPCRA